MNSKNPALHEQPNKNNEPLFDNTELSKLILTPENWRTVAEQRIVRLEDSDDEEHPVIEVNFNQESFRFATLYNFSVILGKPKSRKSTFLVLLISEVLKSVK